MSEDLAHMRAALALARRALGTAWPNPAVGCVIVQKGRVVGRGWTQPGGRPHAETEALRRAGALAQGATVYVTLEPCSHYGRTPPCCDALLAAGVARVVVALRDPDPRVDGRGLARLRAGGVCVEEGLCATEARALNAGFLRRISCGLPLVTLKLATTLDGRIALPGGVSRWLTGEEARRAAHALRARQDAILVGSGTVLADDPELTCRLPGLVKAPHLRVIADARLRTPLQARVVRSACAVPTWLVTVPGHAPAALAPYIEAGVEIRTVAPGREGGVALRPLLAALAERGVTRLLVEGGGNLRRPCCARGWSIVSSGFIRRLCWAKRVGRRSLPSLFPGCSEGRWRRCRAFGALACSGWAPIFCASSNAARKISDVHRNHYGSWHGA